MGLRMKFMACFWEHCLTSMMLISSYGSTYFFFKYILKDKTIKSSWISKGLKKFSKKKQRIYINFFVIKTLEGEFKYKTYKKLFEKLRKKTKVIYYSKLLHKYQADSKRTWQVMKKVFWETNKIKSPPHRN